MKRSGRRPAAWTAADIERAEAWWKKRRQGAGGEPSAPEQQPAAREEPAVAAPEPATELRPAIPAHLSVHSEYLICMACGARHRDLGPHLEAAHGLEPDAYRRRWNLPDDYSMICPWDRIKARRRSTRA